MAWVSLAKLRWGPAIGDPTPGIIVEGPSRRVVLDDSDDPYAVDERLAIMAEAREAASHQAGCGIPDLVQRWAGR